VKLAGLGAHLTSLRDRRVQPRACACFPIHVHRKNGAARLALSRNLSTTGALLVVRSNLDVGERISLLLCLSEDRSDTVEVSGRVIRVEPRALDRADVWTHRVAVQFDAPIRDCRAELRAISLRQSEMALPRD
jgi:Tfp pilus assembly protein PilZ